MEEITSAHGNKELQLCSRHTFECNKQTNRVHASVSWLRSTQIFIPCTRGRGGAGQEFTGGELKVSNFRLLSVSCTCSPRCAPHPSFLFFFLFSPNFCCSTGRSEARAESWGWELKSYPCWEKHPLFRVNIRAFSVLPSLFKRR